MRRSSMAFATAFLASVSYFLKLEIKQLVEADRVKFLKEEAENGKEGAAYDFVIVGAGTSGCILANRLSKNYRVLLLDAGTTPPSLVRIPALYNLIENFDGGINLFYNSIPQNASFGRVLTSSFGKMLGGSYSHNAMIFNRGSRYDYDNWAKILQDKSFKYKNMLKYFKKVETYIGDFPGRDRGTKGLIPIETDNLPISDTWFAAGRELGYPTVGDPTGVPRSVFTPIELSRFKGRRCTTYTQYIEPILAARKNLKVIRLATVDRVTFSGKVATGVVYHRHEKKFHVTARKEVILTAGTFGTALILFKSGVGLREMLEKAKIPVVADLPIGENLEDHPVIYIKFTYTDTSKFQSLYSKLTEEIVNKYVRGEREDVLSRTNIGPQAFLASKFGNKFQGKLWPDLQLVLSGIDKITQPENVDKQEGAIGIVNGRPAYTKDTIPTLKLDVEKYRRGVRNSTDLALIDYKILQNEHINSVLLEGIRITLKILGTEAFKAIGAKLIPDQKCSKQFNVETDDYWRCFLRNHFGIYRHPVGTCRMGSSPRPKDSGSVVNTRFQVFGVSNLRVADASVFPKITSANINAAVAAMAEKAAAEIITYYR